MWIAASKRFIGLQALSLNFVLQNVGDIYVSTHASDVHNFFLPEIILSVLNFRSHGARRGVFRLTLLTALQTMCFYYVFTTFTTVGYGKRDFCRRFE